MGELNIETNASKLRLFPLPPPPAPGDTVAVAPGVYWLPTFLPFRPNTVNLWLLQDPHGWTMVDCGYPVPQVKTQIEAAWSKTLQGMPITRLVVTHQHPDHSGNCRWICEHWGIHPTMTQGEHQAAQLIMGDGWAKFASRRLAFWRMHGLPEATSREIENAWNHYRKFFAPLPERWERIQDQDVLHIDGYDWQIIVGQGHAPEQALLYSPQRDLLIAGDQVLGKITPNISVFDDKPDAEPLSLFLNSNRRIARTCGDALVLPSHHLPFAGLQSRIQTIERHHDERLLQVEDELKKGPQSAADLIPALFGQLEIREIGFALGEAIAHLHHLVAQGRAERMARNGTILFAARSDQPKFSHQPSATTSQPAD